MPDRVVDGLERCSESSASNQNFVQIRVLVQLRYKGEMNALITVAFTVDRLIVRDIKSKNSRILYNMFPTFRGSTTIIKPKTFLPNVLDGFSSYSLFALLAVRGLFAL